MCSELKQEPLQNNETRQGHILSIQRLFSVHACKVSTYARTAERGMREGRNSACRFTSRIAAGKSFAIAHTCGKVGKSATTRTLPQTLRDFLEHERRSFAQSSPCNSPDTGHSIKLTVW